MTVNRLDVEEVIGECRRHQVTKVDVLGFEFEMGLFPNALEEAKSKGIALSSKYIPCEVFDKRAVERKQVAFYDMAYIGASPHIVEGKLANFSVYWTQDSMANAKMALEKKSSESKIIVDNGQIVKVTKDKRGSWRREVLTNEWTDWIDYWAVDDAFENKWQSIRRKRKDRRLELERALQACLPGGHKLAIKAMDIFATTP